MEDYIGARADYEPKYKDVLTYFQNIGNLYTWEADPWYETCKSWAETCYIHAGISGAEITFQGKDAQAFLSKLCMNNISKWKNGKNKHLVMLDEEGLIAAHCLSMKDDDNTYRITAALPFAAMKLLETGAYDVKMTMRDIFVFQFSGPKSLTIIEKLTNTNLHDLAFLQFRKVSIPGLNIEVEVNRIGMSGTLAYEIRGLKEDGPNVYHAAYEIGKPMGLKRLGWRSYPVNHAFGGYPQVTVSFESASYKDPKVAEMSPANISYTGSVEPENLRARFRTPVEVGWQWMAKLDHDFIGRKALEKEMSNPQKMIVSLIWNPEDILDVQASLYGEGEPYKQMEYPCCVPGMCGGHQDYVTTRDGKVIGLSSSAVYSSHYHKMISECTIDMEYAKEGEEVIVKWGDYGKRIKDIRAVIAKFPLNDLVENKNYDISSCPYGFEE